MLHSDYLRCMFSTGCTMFRCVLVLFSLKFRFTFSLRISRLLCIFRWNQGGWRFEIRTKLNTRKDLWTNNLFIRECEREKVSKKGSNLTWAKPKTHFKRTQNINITCIHSNLSNMDSSSYFSAAFRISTSSSMLELNAHFIFH